MDNVRRNVLLLSVCQALLLINNVVFTTLNGLAGYMLATDKSLATLPVAMLAGATLNLICVAIALSGNGVAHFWFALFLLGIGWNFLFVGATTLLTETYKSQEKALVQGINDACVFATMAVSSFASGLLLHADGWTMLNRISIGPLAILTIALVWLAWLRRMRAPAVTA